MAEEKYESKITSSPCSASAIYQVCTDLSSIEKVKHLIPEDKVKELEAGEDYVRFKVDGLGQKICIRIIDREENDYVKFGVENIPLEANFWIQMKQVAVGDTRLRLTIKADIPMMFKMIIGNKLQEGLDRGAEMLAQMPFEQWAQKG